MPERQQVLKKTAKKMVGRMVCVALNDGSYYIGEVMGVKKGELILAGFKGNRKITGRKSLKSGAKVSGLLGSLLGGFGMLRPFFGGGGGGGLFRGSAGGTGGSGGLGFFGKVWPAMRIGFKMMRFIWPLFSKLA